MLDGQDDHQHKDSQEQVFHRAEVGHAAAAAKGGHAHRDQAEADGQHHGAGDHRGEEPAQRLQEEAQNSLKQTAQNGSAHHGAVGGEAAAHGSGYRIEYADKTGGSAHDNGNTAADGAQGEELDQGDQTGHQHGVLEQSDLKVCKFIAGQAAGAGDDEQRGQVSHKHGQHMLQTQGNGLAQRHFSLEAEGFLGELVLGLHKFLLQKNKWMPREMDFPGAF